MDKKKAVIIGTLLIFLLILGVFVVVKNKKTEPSQKILTTSETKPRESKLVSYQDEAGFKFDYPEDLIIKEITGSDANTYSLLEISTSQLSGKMLIKIVDSDFSSIDDWLKSGQASQIGATREITLADIPAKQIQFSDPRRLVSLAINDGIMYFFETPLDEEGKWNKIHNQIISSFSFLIEKSENNPQGTDEEDIIYEEETIE